MNRFDAQDALIAAHHTKTISLHNHKRESVRRQLLEALAFPEMNERRNMVEKRLRDFGDTCRWLFSCPDCVHQCPHDSCIQSDFVQWLYNGTEIFWISGKPGSGKSQLMDFIRQSFHSNGPSFAPLAAWANGKHVHVLDFWFFKPATSVLLKTLQGFWRSLCFQILDQDKSLVEKVVHGGSNEAPESLRSSLQLSGTNVRSWTDRELSSWFLYLLSATEHKFLLLLDGLDENADDHEGLLETIHHLVRSSRNIKICCSSRPEPLIARSLEHCPMLRLQDLNFADIETYCSRRLDDTRAAVHAYDIAKRAEGVFLWAYLVAEDLRRGSMLGDGDKDLEQRLNETPTEMNDLFEFMLKRQDRYYVKHPKPYLLLLNAAVQADSSPTLLQLLLASRDLESIKSQITNGPDANFLTDLNESARNMEINVIANCAGLVETERTYHSVGASYEYIVEAAFVRLRFIHRSVQDFLLESESGVQFLRSSKVPKDDAFKRLMTASALVSVMNRAFLSFYKAFDESLHYAGSIPSGSWTSSETHVLDALFSSMVSNQPAVLEKLKASTIIKCPQLSELDNIALGHPALHRLTPYLEAKLPRLAWEETSLAAGFIVSAILRNETRLDDDMAKILRPYISWTQCVTLCHLVGHSGAWTTPLTERHELHVTASRPLWQHCFIGNCNNFLGEPDTAQQPPFTVLDLDLRQTILDNRKLDSLSTGALLIAQPSWEFFPDPEDGCANESLYYHEAFKTTLIVPDSEPFGPPLVSFEQYCPETLCRFLTVEPEMKESLKHEFDKGSFIGIQQRVYQEYTTSILNDNVGVLSPAEIADIVCLGRARLFSNGRFILAGWAEVDKYVSRLMNGDFGEYFGSEQDPVLLEIVKRETKKLFTPEGSD
ncbi:hypothetical protein H2204_006026 [Knufia peltigerae]|uniref:NACHT domain-containing protein n=1 Tax=Knufia peltigerae TaxID=1002370 RepID=A0AA39CWY8_9EURO|nr:hypothetical protein H2204_006026 [Knufia peltigerae]